ncbi:MAG: hypothetical protein HXX11_04635 [Desulfuromonadales bacterium]|nr:hypothetical protein [Desulfuromonadales bacterium]
MNWFLKGILTLGLALFIAGCGSGGTTAIGNTVAVTAGITTGSAGSVFANISTTSTGSSVFTASPISVTLTSVATSTNNTVPTSPVSISRISMSLTPLPSSNTDNSSNALSPVIPNPAYTNITQGVGGVIPGPGTLKIDGIPILGLSDGAVLLNAFTASKLTNVQYNYIANLLFFCVEANTGKQILVPWSVGVEVSLRAP